MSEAKFKVGDLVKVINRPTLFKVPSYLIDLKIGIVKEVCLGNKLTTSNRYWKYKIMFPLEKREYLLSETILEKF